jgi:hypothetical protein
MEGSLHNAHAHSCFGECTAEPDVGANPIFSVGDGALLHGAGAGASAGAGTGAGAGAGSSAGASTGIGAGGTGAGADAGAGAGSGSSGWDTCMRARLGVRTVVPAVCLSHFLCG